MYSRNISFPERVTGVRDVRMGDSRASRTIPVKSYTDRAAYEHFGNIGKIDSEFANETSNVNNVFVTKQEMPPEERETLPSNEPENTLLNQNNATKEVRSNNKREESGLTDLLESFKGLFNSDLILPVFAIILFLLGEKESNNTLTSLALIAVMLV